MQFFALCQVKLFNLQLGKLVTILYFCRLVLKENYHEKVLVFRSRPAPVRRLFHILQETMRLCRDPHYAYHL